MKRLLSNATIKRKLRRSLSWLTLHRLPSTALFLTLLVSILIPSIIYFKNRHSKTPDKLFQPRFVKSLSPSWDYQTLIPGSPISSAIKADQKITKVNFKYQDSVINLNLPLTSTKISQTTNQGIKIVPKEENIEVHYQVQENGLKEDIILLKKPTVSQFVSSFDITNTKVSITSDGLPVFFNTKTNDYVFHFQKPYAYDASGNKTYSVEYSITPKGQPQDTINNKKGVKKFLDQLVDLPESKEYQLIVRLDPDWLFDSKRTYPITIDPTIVHDTGFEFATGDFNRTSNVGGSAPNASAWWNFDEASGTSASDSSGNNRTATATNTSIVSGKYGNARSISGAGSYLSFSNTSIHSLPFSYTAWIKIPSYSGYKTIFQTDSTNNGNYYGFWSQVDATGSFGITYGDGTAAGPTGRRSAGTPANTIPTNRWVHVAAVVRGPTDMSLYIDGVGIGNSLYTGSGGALASASSTGLIGSNGAYANNLNGEIDDLRFFNSALSATQIKSIYNQYSPTVSIETNDVFGTGQDGNCIVSSTSNDNLNSESCVGRGYGDAVNFQVTANVTSGQKQITLASAPTGLALGDEVLIINLKGTSTDFLNVGKFDTGYITNISGNTLTLDRNLKYGYDGTTQKIMVQRVPNYGKVNVNSSQTMTVNAWDGNKNGVMFFRSLTDITVNGSINMDGKGFLGGQGAPAPNMTHGYNGEGINASRVQGAGANIGGGAAGLYNGNSVTAPGGGGSYGTKGDGVPGNFYGVSNLEFLYLGSGGGGGSTWIDGTGSGSGGAGGNGGGIVALYTPRMNLRIANAVSSDGVDGAAGVTHGSGGSGGASGSILLATRELQAVPSSVSINPGTGGAGYSGRNGFSGGTGRLALFYEKSYTGVAMFAHYTEKKQFGSNYGVYTSPIVDLGDNILSWNSLSWEEVGVATGDGETLSNSAGLVAQWNFNDNSGSIAAQVGGSCAAACNGNLTNFVNTGAQDVGVTPASGWTAVDRRWGGGALKFDGLNDYVSIPNTAALNVGPTDSFTYETWFKTSAGGSYQNFIRKDNSGTTPRTYTILRLNTNNTVAFYVNDSVAGGLANSDETYNDGNWHHAVGVRDKSIGKILLYVDGVLQSSVNDASTLTLTNSAPLTLGSFYNNGSPTEFLNGVMDSTRIYSRALSAEEVLSNYNNGQIELQTRTSADGTTWEGWRPVSPQETAMLAMNNDALNWKSQSVASANVALSLSNVGNTAPPAPTDCTVNQPILINNLNNNSALTNYQVKIDVPYRAGMEGDLSGLRFTNATGTNLNYWVESFTPMTSGTVWVKVDSIPANSSIYIYMWYGNCTGGLTQSGTNTFDYFNDFTTLSDWTNYGTGSALSRPTTSTIQLTNSAGTCRSWIVPNTQPVLANGTIEYRYRHNSSTFEEGGVLTRISSATPQSGQIDGYQQALRGGASNDLPAWRMNDMTESCTAGTITTITNISIGWTADQSWYRGNLNLNGSTFNFKPDTYNYASTSNIYSDTSFASGGIGFWIYNNSQLELDWVFIHKNSSIEPIAKIVTLEKQPKIEGVGSLEISAGQINETPEMPAYWHLDETSGVGAYVKDSSINSHNITPSGTTVIDGQINKARQFNGTSESYSVPNDTSLNLNHFTVEMWIKPERCNYAPWQGIIGKGAGAVTSRNYSLFVASNSCLVHYSFANGAAYASHTSANPLNLNQWQHIAYTFDGKTSKFYINGVVDSSYEETIDPIFNTDPLTIGRITNYDYFKGGLDEIAIYNRAKTDEEIHEDARAGADNRFTRTIGSTNLSTKNKIPFYIASDKKGPSLEATIGESSYAINESDANTLGLWHFDENSIGDALADDFNDGSINDWTLGSGSWIAGNLANQLSIGQTCSASCAFPMVAQKGSTAWAKYSIDVDIYTPSAGVTASHPGVIFQAADTNNYNVVYFRPHSSGASNAVQWANVAGGTLSSGSTATATIPWNAWYHVRVDVNGAISTVYVNGVNVGTNTLSRTSGKVGLFAHDSPAYFDNFRVTHPALNFGGDINSVKDSSSNGKHATPQGTYIVKGVIGNARYFEGASYIPFGPIGTTAPTTETTEMWIKPHTRGAILQECDNPNCSSYVYTKLGINTDGTLIGHMWSIGAGNTLAFGKVTFGNWYHLAMTYDNTNLKAYLNGSLVYQKSGARTPPATLYLALGKGSAQGAGGFDSNSVFYGGAIDEFRYSNIARTADDIRQSYEIGKRSHQVYIDFKAALLASNPISNNLDLSFAIDETPYGEINKIANLYPGDNIIIKENYDGTEYFAQGEVVTVNNSTGAVTVSDWDSNSTFPSAGFTSNATVFKWQREYFPITDSLTTHRDATTKVSFRLTPAAAGSQIWVDDFKNSSTYLTNNLGVAVPSTVNRYFQYRSIITTTDYYTSPSFSSVTLDYLAQEPPVTPTLNSLYQQDNIRYNDLTPEIRFSSTDVNNNDIIYEIQYSEDHNFSTFDNASSDSSSGFSNITTPADTSPFTTGNTISYTFQTNLENDTTYYYRLRAKDPTGSNQWSGWSETKSFTTNTSTTFPQWHQTLAGQFQTDDLGPNLVINQASHQVTITSGTSNLLSTAIDYQGLSPSATRWSMLHFNDNEATGDIKYRLFYDNAGTPTIIPNGSLPGNSTGFDSSPVNLTALTTAAYPKIYVQAVFTYSGGSPILYDWTVGVNAYPSTPTLNSPTNGATGQSGLTRLRTTGTDFDSDYLKYKIELCTNSGMTDNCQVFDQTVSQVGWSGQNASGNTAYTSGTTATYVIQSALSAGSTYYWRSYSIDPAGTNTWSPVSSVFSYTTSNKPNSPTLDSPLHEEENVSVTPQLRLTATDPDSDPLQYTITLCENYGMSQNCQIFSQSLSQTGWSGQNALSNTAYTSGTQAIYTVQAALQPLTVYYWRATATDPTGSAIASDLSPIQAFTTFAGIGTPGSCVIDESSTDNRLTLRWIDQSSNETGFLIQRKVNSAAFADLYTAGVGITGYIDNNVFPNNTYAYRVKATALLSSNDSNWCNFSILNLNQGGSRYEGLKIEGVKLD